jgi:hypothetical protein
MGNSNMDIDGHLRYLVENCDVAFKELKRLNCKLQAEMSSDSSTNPNATGALHRMVQDYLIIRVAGLFDKKTYTSSFAVAYGEDENYKKIRKELIIEYMIKMRSTFVGHTHQNLTYGYPDTNKILTSNIPRFLNDLLKILPPS